MYLWLKKHEWTLVAGAVVLGFVAGLVGFGQFLGASGKEASFFDFIYFAIRLFLFNYDLPGDGVPYAAPNATLEVARFLCPTTVFYTGIRGVTVALARRLSLWGIRNWSGHTIIVGGGKRGTELARALVGRSRRTIVVDLDEGCEYQTGPGSSAARVVIGDIRDVDVQKDARLSSASLVIAVTNSPEVNLELALAAANRGSSEPLRLLIHAPRKFSEIFEDLPPFDKQYGSVESRFFSYDYNAARALALEFAPLLAAKRFPSGSPRILLLGDNAFLAELLCSIITQFQFAFSGPPEVVVLSDAADCFEFRLPSAAGTSLPLVSTVRISTFPSHQLLKPDIASLTAGVLFDLAFVAFVKDANALHCARHLSTLHLGLIDQIVTCLRPSHNLIRAHGGTSVLPGVEIRNLVPLGCSMEAVVDGSLDAAAREIHERYVREETAKGMTLSQNSLLVSWQDLPEAYREANRSQADNSEVKKRQLHLDQSQACIESMAEAEHRRWMANRILSGWRYGPVRDNKNKIHPSIVSYARLSEAEKQKDRDTITLFLKEI